MIISVSNRKISPLDEDIVDEESFGELLIMDGTAAIFGKLKLNFGKIVKLKKHFKTIVERTMATPKNKQKNSKPTMAVLESGDPAMKALYLKK